MKNTFKKSEANNRARIESAKKKREDLSDENEVLLKKVKNLHYMHKVKTEQLGDLTEAVQTMDQMKSIRWKINDKIKTGDKQIQFYTDNQTCPTCTRPIDDSFRTEQ